MNTPMHRFGYTKLTKEQIAPKIVRTATGPKCVSGFSDVLVGKSLKIVTDGGPVLSYSFKDKNRLTFSENGGTSVEAGYGALTLKQMVFFSHMAPKTLNGYNVFVDLDSNLVTIFEVCTTLPRPMRPERKLLSATIGMAPPLVCFFQARYLNFWATNSLHGPQALQEGIGRC